MGHVLCTSLRPRGVEYAQGRQEREEEGEGDVVVMFVVMGVGGWTRAPLIEGLSALLAVWRARNMQGGATGLLFSLYLPRSPRYLFLYNIC